ncbi:MAG TPA: DNA-binding protein [Halobacteria archaeon]|jgi:hypothetical protein|nr:DNA-binding protein [Halobacteria archaeon]HIH77630.1 DNA-binding protein [Halobacteria archaeon]
MKIILDTNILLVPGQYKIDVFDELIRLGYTEFIITDSIVRELLILSKKYKSKKDIMAVNLAMSLIDRCKIVRKDGVINDKKIFEHSGKKTIADDDILELADDIGAVATNDKKLIRDLKKKGVKVVRLRQKKFLVEE